MVPSRISGLIAVCVTATFVATATASKTILPPAQEGEVADLDNNGTGDVAAVTDTPIVSTRPDDTYRSVHEFNLGGFKNAALTSAVLTGTYGPNNSLDVGVRQFRVMAYTGNGVLETADFSAVAMQVGTFSYAPPYPTSTFSIDATATVQAMLNMGDTNMAFRIEPVGTDNPPNWMNKVQLTVQRPAVTGPVTLTLTSPNGGQALVAGNPLTVAWTATGLAPASRIAVLIRKGIGGPGAITGMFEFHPGLEFTVGQGQATMKVPTWLGDGGNYYAELWVLLNDDIVASDVGDGPFNISGSGAIRRFDLNRPTAGARWPAGVSNRITWTAENLDGSVFCAAFEAGRFVANTAFVLPSDGRYDWTIPARIGNGTDYEILALHVPPGYIRSGSTLPFDTAGPFEIYGAQPRPVLQVTSPNGGEVWTGGTASSFCYDRDDTTPTVRSQMTRGDGLADAYNFSSLTSGMAATTCSNWTACRYFGGDDFRIYAYMSHPDGLFVTDRSDGYFTVNAVDPPPTIKITQPVGGLILYPAGGYQTIRWDAADAALVSYVGISLLTTNSQGTRETVLASNERAVNCGYTGNYCGEYGFFFCPDLEPDAQYRVRVCVRGYGCPDLCDLTEPFTITPWTSLPTLTLTSPVGGEAWALGSTHAVTWNAANADGMDVEVMLAGMTSDSGPTLATAPASAGTANVTMPSNPYYANNGWTILLEIRSPEGCLQATDRSGAFALRAFSCGNGYCDPGETVATCPGDCSPAADFDRDGYVNLTDLEHLEQCADGPSIGPPAPGCGDADLDWDEDVDSDDFAAWQRCLSGAMLADPLCDG